MVKQVTAALACSLALLSLPASAENGILNHAFSPYLVNGVSNSDSIKVCPALEASKTVNLNYLIQEGHLPRKHWYSVKPGRKYWLYAVKNSGAPYLSFQKIDGVPDIRPLSERNPVVRPVTAFIKWAAPMAVTTLLGIKD